MPHSLLKETRHTRDFREQYAEDLQIFLKARALKGESAAIALRRLLGMTADEQSRFNRLQECLKTFEFLASRTYTKRYLLLLGALYAQNSSLFETEVENLALGARVYFSRSPKDIERSGNLPAARVIPGSAPPVWTLTNISTAHKEQIIKAALDAFGYRPITKPWVLRQMKANLRERKARVAKSPRKRRSP